MKQFCKKTHLLSKKNLYFIMLLSCMCALLFMGCGQRMQNVQKADTAMGTIVSQSLYVTADAETAEAISQEIISTIDTLEQDYLSWRLESAEIYRINRNAGSESKILLSDKLFSWLERCQKVYAASDGAFDFTLGSVARLWNIDKWAVEPDKFILPEKEQIAEALQSVGGDKLFLGQNTMAEAYMENTSAKNTYLILLENLQLDLGAVGKGIALDEIRTLLQTKEQVSGGVISVGGSILTYGSKPDGGKWNVGIVDPMETSKNMGVLQLSGEWCVSTSGDYERYVEVDGVCYHHILNPATGYPADSGLRSVTILSRSGLDSDALSTACFVLGAEKGMELVQTFGAEALFVLENGEIVISEGMKQYFHLSNGRK